MADCKESESENRSRLRNCRYITEKTNEDCYIRVDIHRGVDHGN